MPLLEHMWLFSRGHVVVPPSTPFGVPTGAAAIGGGGGSGGGTKKKLQDATNDELMSLVKHHSSRLKIVEEEYSKLKQKVGGEQDRTTAVVL